MQRASGFLLAQRRFRTIMHSMFSRSIQGGVRVFDMIRQSETFLPLKLRPCHETETPSICDAIGIVAMRSRSR